MKFLVVGDDFARSFLFVDAFRKYFQDANFIKYEALGFPQVPGGHLYLAANAL